MNSKIPRNPTLKSPPIANYSHVALNYAADMQAVLANYDWVPVTALAQGLWQAWQSDQAVFLCGNGGSAANAIHLANDFLYGIHPGQKAMRVMALPANASIVTCLGNDEGYDQIFAQQLVTLARAEDWLIVFSGSGNSPNVIQAIATAKDLGMHTAAVLGYAGGQCKNLVDIPIHFAIEDMQIAEDLQMVVGHMLTRILIQMRENLHEHRSVDGHRQ